MGNLFSTKQQSTTSSQQDATSRSNLFDDPRFQGALSDYFGGQFSPSTFAGIADPNAFQTGAAGNQAGLAGNALGTAFNTANTIAGQGLDPNAIAQYMSPYTDAVVSPTLAAMDIQNRQGISALRGNQAARGALGNSTGAEAAYMAAVQPGQQAQIAGLYNQGYGQAQQAALASLQARLSGAGTTGSLTGVGTQANQGLFGMGQQLWQNTLAPYTLTGQWAQGLSPFLQAAGMTSSATGSGTGTQTSTPGIGSVAAGLAGAYLTGMSDARVKENIRRVGATFDGQPIYAYNFPGGPTQVGLIAQDVERVMPEAVGEVDGVKTVDYDLATAPAAMAAYDGAGGAPGAGGAGGAGGADGAPLRPYNGGGRITDMAPGPDGVWQASGAGFMPSGGPVPGGPMPPRQAPGQVRQRPGPAQGGDDAFTRKVATAFRAFREMRREGGRVDGHGGGRAGFNDGGVPMGLDWTPVVTAEPAAAAGPNQNMQRAGQQIMRQFGAQDGQGQQGGGLAQSLASQQSALAALNQSLMGAGAGRQGFEAGGEVPPDREEPPWGFGLTPPGAPMASPFAPRAGEGSLLAPPAPPSVSPWQRMVSALGAMSPFGSPTDAGTAPLPPLDVGSSPRLSPTFLPPAVARMIDGTGITPESLLRSLTASSSRRSLQDEVASGQGISVTLSPSERAEVLRFIGDIEGVGMPEGDARAIDRALPQLRLPPGTSDVLPSREGVGSFDPWAIANQQGIDRRQAGSDYLAHAPPDLPLSVIAPGGPSFSPGTGDGTMPPPVRQSVPPFGEPEVTPESGLPPIFGADEAAALGLSVPSLASPQAPPPDADAIVRGAQRAADDRASSQSWWERTFGVPAPFTQGIFAGEAPTASQRLGMALMAGSGPQVLGGAGANLLAQYQERTRERLAQIQADQLAQQATPEIVRTLEAAGFRRGTPEFQAALLRTLPRDRTESAATIALAQAGVKEIQERTSAVNASQSQLGVLDRIQSLIDTPGVPQGRLAHWQLEGRRLANALFPGTFDNVGEGEALRALTSQIALELRSPSAGAGMPGAMSDADRVFLTQMAPNLLNTPEGNRLLVRIMRDRATYQTEANREAIRFLRANPAGYGELVEHMSRWMRENPMSRIIEGHEGLRQRAAVLAGGGEQPPGAPGAGQPRLPTVGQEAGSSVTLNQEVTLESGAKLPAGTRLVRRADGRIDIQQSGAAATDAPSSLPVNSP